MTKNKSLHGTRNVNVSLNLTQPEYNALQRWRGTNKKNQSQSIVQGLQSLPGYAALLDEEKEAYATIIKEGRSQEAAVAKEANRFDQDHHNPRNPR